MQALVFSLFFALMFVLPASTITARADSVALTPATLKSMLEGMGYKATDGKFSNGDPYTKVSIKKGKWDYELLANANNPELIFISADFGLYQGKSADIPQPILLGLLTENRKTNFVRFLYLDDVNKFRLLASLRNRDVLPIDLRAVLSEIVDTADATQNLWDPKNWPEETKETGAAAVQPEPAIGGNQAAK